MSTSRPIAEAWGATYVKAGDISHSAALQALTRCLNEWRLECLESGDAPEEHLGYRAARYALVNAHSTGEVNKSLTQRLMRMQREFIKWKKD